MQKKPSNHIARWAFAVVGLGTFITSATAGSFTRGCAARDLQILAMIEEREGANAVSPEQLSDTMWTMMHARMVCHEGRVVDALAIYDNVARGITPNPLVTGQRQ